MDRALTETLMGVSEPRELSLCYETSRVTLSGNQDVGGRPCITIIVLKSLYIARICLVKV